MARVQCADCDMPVVVDPHGRCPEGHELGPVGARIEQSLGRAEPHPDEPQPWVAVLQTAAAEAEVAASEPRAARPISVGPESSDDDLDIGAKEGLLHELHELHGGSDKADSGGSPSARVADLTPSDASESLVPPAPSPDAWDEWDLWDDETTSATPDAGTAGDPEVASDDAGAATTPGETAAGDNPAPSGETAAGDHAAPSGETPTEETPDRPQDPDDDLPPAPRRAPTLRSEESMSAIAELAALVDDGPSSAHAPAPTPERAPTPTPTPTPPSSDEHDRPSTGDRLATVSQLPVRRTEGSADPAPPPPPPPPPSSGSSNTDAQPPQPDQPDQPDQTDQTDQTASGESIDWSNFTAKGKKRRFGR